jgi:glycosyltransferase involved in cell wall biosynthesis
MDAALIIDEERLACEHSALNRLAVGLIGEGVQITRIVPPGVASGPLEGVERRVALARRIEAPMRVLPWMRRDRVERIAEAFDRTPPDVLHAFGVRGWALGRDLARRLERPLALEVWSAPQVQLLPRGRAGDPVAAYIAPSRPIAEAISARVDPALVCHVPPGVATPEQPRIILDDPARSIALAIIGTCGDPASYRALLTGMECVVREMPQVQAFLSLHGPHEHEIWRLVRDLDLLESVSALADAPRTRDLLTRCDVLLVPERLGQLTSLTLEAMALGLPVIAAADPFLDVFIDGETASVVRGADADEWARRLRALLTDPEHARALGLSGRAMILEKHRSSAQVAQLRAVYAQIVTGGAYRFDARGAEEKKPR